MLTYTAATSYVADIFLRRVRVRFRVTVYTQLAVGVYWESTPLTASAEIFKVYISFTLFTCDCTLIYTLMYCVCQHTDPGMAQIHRGLTRFESGHYRNGDQSHSMTSQILGCRPYQQQSRGSFVCNYIFDLSMELGIPITGPFLVSDRE